MDALKILDKEKEQSVDYDQVKLGDLKLQNFIQLYEEVEKRAQVIEIETINKRYLEDTKNDQGNIEKLKQLIENMKKEYEFEQKKEDQFYADIESVMNIIGRFCFRTLKNYQKELANENLFEYLKKEQNYKYYERYTAQIKGNNSTGIQKK